MTNGGVAAVPVTGPDDDVAAGGGVAYGWKRLNVKDVDV